jgi:citrate synthase
MTPVQQEPHHGDAPDDAESKTYMRASEVMAYLRIRHQTLYAYVSRGWIRSEKQAGKRFNLYFREDVERVKSRAAVRSGHGAIAATAMQFGEPIIPTSITEIAADGPRYRGHPAVALARQGVSFERVAELLWTGHLPDSEVFWESSPSRDVLRLCGPISQSATRNQFMEIFALIALTAGIARGGVAQRRYNGNPLEAAREVLRLLVGCMGYLASERKFMALRRGDSVAQGVLRALGGAERPEDLQAVQAILVLLADHELAPGSFAARVAASSGASLHGCLVSALCTNAGLRAGRVYDLSEEFLSGARSRAGLMKQISHLQSLGRPVPGFTHRLYPKGDPRAVHLLELARARPHRSVRLREFLAFVESAQEELGLHPVIELVVVALCNEMALPRESGGAMFALARSAGWVAHIQEQRLSRVLLRPRAKFTAA